jgi:choline dehydrogenase-like flavoprotein
VIVDLAAQQGEHRRVETDVLVIGSGVAGLILAARLRRNNIRVIVLESGGREQATARHPLNRVIQLGEPYSGASQGRFRCLGGTSTRWGGALIPFSEHDLDARPYLGLPALPVAIDALRPYLGQAERLFGLDAGSYEEEFVRQIGADKWIPTGDADFNVRFAKWPTFKKRNVAVLFSELIEHDTDLAVWINSTATNFQLNRDNGRLESVRARCANGRSVEVAAKEVAVCAGAIESTRLLLLLDRQYDGHIFKDCNALGRYFYDHVSIPMARINAKQINKLNRMAAFRFVGSTMRSLRFELSAGVQERECVGSAFGHISFRTERSTGFDALRQLLRSQQRIGHINPMMLLDVGRDARYLARAVIWRVFRRQLLWPNPATFEVHVVAEQMPEPSNQITLSSETDQFDLPVAAINWRASNKDWNTFAIFMRHFDKFWKRRGLQEIGILNWMHDLDSPATNQMLHSDVYHPGGSTRMGVDHHSAIVDPNLKVFKLSNLWVSSTSILPSGGGANPTLTLILFTMRLADRLRSRLRGA